MTKVNPNNGIETKWDIFPWDIFKSEVMYFLSTNIEVFQWLSESKFLSFITKGNPSNRNETKSGVFSWDIFKSDIVFIGHKILKYFSDFQNWHLSVSLQK